MTDFRASNLQRQLTMMADDGSDHDNFYIYVD